MNCAKKALRIHIKNLISLMSAEEKCRQSDIIFEKLIKCEQFINSKTIGVYLSMDREVNTIPILEYCLNSGKMCFIPKYVGNSRDMNLVQLSSMVDYHSLPLTAWKIKQPSDEDTGRADWLSVGGLDLIIIPGVAFTKLGHRLGNGGGYYDTFLNKHLLFSKQNETNVPVLVGLAFDKQIVDAIPVDGHDIQLDFVLFADQRL